MSQGHWRTLKANQVGEGRFGEATRGKTWVDREESKGADKAKTKGEVPPPKLVGKKGEFFAFAVPGGRFMFVVHERGAKQFAELTAKPNWQKSKQLKSFMNILEKQGLFGIYKTDEAILGYS